MLLAKIPRARYVATLGAILAGVVIASGIGAHYPHDWLLENALVLVLLAFLAITARRLPLSRISYTLLFLFLCLHELSLIHI